MKLRWKIAQAAELRWWKNYLKNQSVSSYLSDKKEYWKRVLKQLEVEPEIGNKILDAGCGPAGIFTILEDYEVDAIDPLLEDYESNLPHFNPEAYPKVQFFKSTIEEFKSPKPYDLIFCLNAINHVDDLSRSLDNLFSSLSEGGKLVLSTDTHKHALLNPIFKTIPGDILHPHQYDLEEYREMLLTRGARIKKEICLKKGNIFDYWVWVIEI